MRASATAFPTYGRIGGTPRIPPGEDGGIAICCPSPVRLGTGTAFALYGAFAVRGDEAGRFPGHLLQAAVVLLRGPMPVTRRVGEGQLLFEEDVVRDGDLVRGYFNLDLFSFFGLVREPNRYWVNASIFGHVSDVATVEIVA
jgi:hypothetical protein